MERRLRRSRRRRGLLPGDTHGPDGGPYLFDDVVRSAWMFISETDGRLTRWFEDTIFPEGVHPVAGPATADGAMYSRPGPGGTTWHPDSVYLYVVYTVSQIVGFKPAVGTVIHAHWVEFPGVPGGGVGTEVVTVPEDGIVAFWCRPPAGSTWGSGHAPDTYLVQGRTDIASWYTNERHCGQLVQVEVLAHRYLPWRLLNLSADTLQKHFGHTRGRIKWKLHFGSGGSYYNGLPGVDKITLAWGNAAGARFPWTVAHEYGHALHHKALGGMWGAGNCDPHSFDVISSYECALQEGFADYAGTVGSGGYYENYFEHFDDLQRDRRPEIEGYVAALFLDLTDDREEEGDYTEYPGLYVAEVFKSCEVKHPRWWRGDWRKRNKVSDIVWCLERLVTPGVHALAFPDTNAPDTVREMAGEPPDWHWSDIRLTWLKNLTDGLVTRPRE
ncbi:MAG: hypothetical protein J4F34_09075 [Gemmatimonadetes bacterium]|nr:hypothetical protein [Gemmatimonadota bacterium]